MLVVDTSALLAAMVGGDAARDVRERLAEHGDLHAPHLIDVELLQALRALVRGGQLTADRATDVRTDLDELTLVRYPHEPLADRVWALRDNLSAYDATFVALAEALGVPLVTCDGRLAAAPGLRMTVEHFAGGG